MSLLKTMEGPYRWVERGQSLPNTDFYCPFMSLPLALKTNLDTIPSETPYLFPSKEVCQRWQDLLGEKTRPRVGLAWSGNSQHVNHRNRSLPLALIHALLGAPFDFHVLQKDLTQEDRLSLKTMEHVFVHADALGDFADTAGLLRQMDLVISVDTSIAHLAGALGYPVWVLLPYLPDFRWMLERSDSPWYPSARLFRQPQRRDWEAVIGDVDAALKAKEF